MKNLLFFFLFSITIITSAGANSADEWQNVDFNIDALNQLNQCNSCNLRDSDFNGFKLHWS